MTSLGNARAGVKAGGCPKRTVVLTRTSFPDEGVPRQPAARTTSRIARPVFNGMIMVVGRDRWPYYWPYNDAQYHRLPRVIGGYFSSSAHERPGSGRGCRSLRICEIVGGSSGKPLPCPMGRSRAVFGGYWRTTEILRQGRSPRMPESPSIADGPRVTGATSQRVRSDRSPLGRRRGRRLPGRESPRVA